MGWKVYGEGHSFEESDERELKKAYKEGCREGYEKAMREMEGGKHRYDDDDDDDDEYGERYQGGGYGGNTGGMYGGGGEGYGERQGVKGTGPYSRYTRSGYVRRGYRRY